MGQEAVGSEDIALAEKRLEGHLRLYGWQHELTLSVARDLIHLFHLADEADRDRAMAVVGAFLANSAIVHGDDSLEYFYAVIDFAGVLLLFGEHDLAIAELLQTMRRMSDFPDWDDGFSAVACRDLVTAELAIERFDDAIAHAEWLFEEVGTEEHDDPFTERNLLEVMAFYACALLRQGAEDRALEWATAWLARAEVAPDEHEVFVDMRGLDILRHIDHVLADGLDDEWLDEIVPRIEELTGFVFEDVSDT